HRLVGRRLRLPPDRHELLVLRGDQPQRELGPGLVSRREGPPDGRAARRRVLLAVPGRRRARRPRRTHRERAKDDGGLCAAPLKGRPRGLATGAIASTSTSAIAWPRVGTPKRPTNDRFLRANEAEGTRWGSDLVGAAARCHASGRSGPTAST